MAAEERIRALLEAAGFERIRTDQVEVTFRFADVDDYVQWAIDMAGPIAMALRELSEDELRTITAQLEQAFAPFSVGGGYTLPGLAPCTVARLTANA